jgi:hypothetical protein
MASCPYVDPTRTTGTFGERFTNVSALDEEIGHFGSPNDRIEIFSQPNPQGLSPVEFARSNPIPGPVPAGSRPAPESVTFAGRPAAQLSFPEYPWAYFLWVGDRDRMLIIDARVSTSTRSADIQTVLRVVRTFRFAGPGEIAAAPQPTPFPAGAPTPQALADLLATAFRQKDVATLERLLAPCVSQSVQNGGGSSITRDRFISSLRDQFANGLIVTVDPATLDLNERYGPGTGVVRSRWNAQPPMSVRTPPPSPGQTTQDVGLILSPTSGGHYWSGTTLLRPR